MKKVLLVSGGDSSERKISLWSAKQVKEALESKNYSVTVFDLRKGKEKLKEVVKNFDVAFPVMHGEEGEGGELQEFLKSLKIPFVGGDPKGFKTGWFKIPFKEYCDKKKIRTALWSKIKTPKDLLEFGFPSVLKTSNGGSSKEVAILASEKDLKNKLVKSLFNSGLPLMVEKFISGIEVTCAILDGKALPLIEIRPPEGSWFNYENKYWGTTEEIPFAPSLNPRVQERVKNIAENIHQDLNLGHYCRIDFMINNNEPFVLEVNTIPGLTSGSLFPKAAKAAGMDFPEAMEKLVQLALKN